MIPPVLLPVIEPEELAEAMRRWSALPLEEQWRGARALARLREKAQEAAVREQSTTESR